MFHREWKTGLAHKYVATILSQQITGACGGERWSSWRTEQIHFISEDAFATDLYSAFVDDRATLFCFFDDKWHDACQGKPHSQSWSYICTFGNHIAICICQGKPHSHLHSQPNQHPHKHEETYLYIWKEKFHDLMCLPNISEHFSPHSNGHWRENAWIMKVCWPQRRCLGVWSRDIEDYQPQFDTQWDRIDVYQNESQA